MKKLFAVVLSVFCFVFSAAAHAAQDLSTRADAISGHLKSLAGMIQIGFILLGLVIVGTGLVKLQQAQRSGMPLGPYIVMLAVGVLMASITAVMLLGSDTLMGSGSLEIDRLGLGL